MRGPAKIATYLGRTLMAVGFLLILIGWNGAASLDYIQGQFPFLMSGSMPGLALIITGAGLEYIQATRQITAKRAKQMAELNLAVVKLTGFVKDNGGFSPGSDLPTEAPARVPVATAAATAAAATSSGAAGGAAADPSSEMVVAGRSSFHEPGCHLVSGRDDMATLTRLEAEGQGLSACRVCKP